MGLCRGGDGGDQQKKEARQFGKPHVSSIGGKPAATYTTTTLRQQKIGKRSEFGTLPRDETRRFLQMGRTKGVHFSCSLEAAAGTTANNARRYSWQRRLKPMKQGGGGRGPGKLRGDECRHVCRANAAESVAEGTR